MKLRTRARVALSAGALVAGAASVASGAPARGEGDERELAVMRAKKPDAAELFERGEGLLAAGALREADAVFREGQFKYPEGSLFWRRDCEARTRLGPREQAIVACSASFERGRSDSTVRALVSALVDGPGAPTSADLYEALLVMKRERDNPLGQTTAAAVACDIAERMGDGAMLQHCAGELTRLAPDDPATRRAQAALSSRCPPWRFWAGWSALLAVIVATLGDALRRAATRLTRRAQVAAGTATFLATASMSLLFAPATARAEETPAAKSSLTRWPVDLEHPENGIPSEKERDADPLQFGYWLQDIAVKGERASKGGDHLTAAKLYNALSLAVPDRAVGFVKMCAEYEAVGDLGKAINACGDALLRDGARVADYSRFVRLMLQKPGPLADKDIAALGSVLAHMRADPAGRETAPDIECQIATRTSNVAQLTECTTELTARAPDDPKTISYSWALAVAERRFDDARTLAKRAGAAGVPADNVAAMDRTALSSQRQRRWQVALAVGAGVVLLAAVALLGRIFLRRRQGGAALDGLSLGEERA